MHRFGPLLLALLLAIPAAADDASLVARAREAASADDHARAIELYERAFAASPALADSHGHELGLQLTWDDRPADAIPWFDRRIAHAPTDLEARLGRARALSWTDRLEEAWFEYRVVYNLDEGNLEARRGEARMLAWMDRLDASVVAYDAILADAPADLEARLGHAQVLNWRGEHFRAARLYEEILRDEPGNPEAMVGLAQALRWSGQERRAMTTLDPIRDNPSATPLYRDLEFAARPFAEFGSSWSQDSDDLEVFGTELAWSGAAPLPIAGRPRMRFGLLHERLWQPGQPDLDLWGLNVGGSGKTSLRTTLNAYVGLRKFTSDGVISGSTQTDDLDWTWLTLDAWWTWLARRDLRVDLSLDRNYVQTHRAVGNETSLTQFGASADWRLSGSWTLSGLLREGFYSDDNRRTSTQLRARWQREREWTVFAAPRLSSFWVSDPRDSGYWNPADFHAIGVDVGASRTFAGEWTPRVGASATREWEAGDGYGTFAISAGLNWRFRRAWELDAGAGASDSRLNTSSGYARDWASLTLRWRY